MYDTQNKWNLNQKHNRFHLANGITRFLLREVCYMKKQHTLKQNLLARMLPVTFATEN